MLFVTAFFLFADADNCVGYPSLHIWSDWMRGTIVALAFKRQNNTETFIEKRELFSPPRQGFIWIDVGLKL